MFLDSQAHWRLAASGHLDAIDVVGFEALITRTERETDAEMWRDLSAMWRAQRAVVNDQVTARLAAAAQR